MGQLDRLLDGPPKRILIAGASTGDDVFRFWLRRSVTDIAAIDIFNHEQAWRKVADASTRQFGTSVTFAQAPLESLPFEDARFDLITSTAVLEHVSNLRAAMCECARVLRPGGLAFHFLGPLYYCFGGDHCIAHYGEDAGYDHLLLDDEPYQRRVTDHDFFKANAPDEWAHAWAMWNQFSFAKPKEYVDEFLSGFDIRCLVAVICPSALAFRRRHREKWARLRASGLTELDLLVKGLSVILQKR